MNLTNTLSPASSKQSVLEKMNAFETRCEELMSLLNAKRQFNLDEREQVKSLYVALKNDLKATAKYGTVSGTSQELTEAERYFYKPAVQKAALALRPATNSDPIKSQWFAAVYEAQAEFAYWRHHMHSDVS